MADSTVGRLIVELRAATASFASDLGKAKHLAFGSAKEIERSFKIMGTAVAGALTAAAGAMATLAIRSINVADEMGKAAQRTGVSVEQFSALAFAAKLSNVSTEQLSTSLIALSKNLEKSNQQTLEGKAAHSALGTLFKGNIPAFRSTSQAFIEISRRLEELPEGFQRTALAAQILGKSGAALLPMTKGLQAAIVEARELGIVISQQTAARAEKFNDTITRLKTVIDAFGIRLAEALLDPLQKIADEFLENAKNAAKMQENVQLAARSVEILARALIGTGLAFKVAADGAAALVLSFQDIASLGTDEVIGRAATEARRAASESFASFRQNLSAVFDEPIAKAQTFGQKMLAAASISMGPVRSSIQGLGEDIGKIRDKMAETIAGLRLQIDTFGQSSGVAASLKAIREGASKVEATIIGQLSQQVELMQKAAGLMPQPRPLAPQFGPDLAPPEMEVSGVDFRDIEFLTDAEKKASELIVPFEVLSTNLDLIHDKFKTLRPLGQELKDSLGDLFEQAIFHADSFVDALGRIAQAIAAMALRMLVIQPLLTSLGGLFGATGGLPLSGATGGASLAGFAPGLAAGGPIFGPRIVGEKGPELFDPGTPGTIIPNDKLFDAIRSGGGSQQVVNNFHFDNVTDADSFKRSKGQMGAWFQRQLAIAHGRNG